MGRAKIVMEPIKNNKKRKITFNTRKQGIIKKARELTVLCDVNVAMIIYTDDQENPQIFPHDRDNLEGLIDLYKRIRCMDPGRVNFYGVSDYFMDRKVKVDEELVKEKKKNVETKYPSWFDFLNNFSELQLREFAFGLENKIVDVKSRIEFVKKISNLQNLDGCSYSPVLIDYSNSDLDPLGFYHQSSISNPVNPIVMPSSYPDSVMNMMLNEDDNVVYGGESFSLQPPLMQHWFQPEVMQQFLMSDVVSHVKNTRANGTEFGDYC